MDLPQMIAFLRGIGCTVVPIGTDTWFVRFGPSHDSGQQILHGREVCEFGQMMYDSYQQIQRRIAQAGHTTPLVLDTQSILDTLGQLRYATTRHLAILYERTPEQMQQVLEALVADRRIERVGSSGGWQVTRDQPHAPATAAAHHDHAGVMGRPSDWLVEVIVCLVGAARLFGLSRISVVYGATIASQTQPFDTDRWRAATIQCQFGAPDRVAWGHQAPDASSVTSHIALTFATEVLDQSPCSADILATQARHYQQDGDASSIPVLVLPDPQSLTLARTTWMHHWPTGVWLMTSYAGLRADMWEGHCIGKVTTGPLKAAMAHAN